MTQEIRNQYGTIKQIQRIKFQLELNPSRTLILQVFIRNIVLCSRFIKFMTRTDLRGLNASSSYNISRCDQSTDSISETDAGIAKMRRLFSIFLTHKD